MVNDITMRAENGDYLVLGIQLKPRALCPRWLGNLILWMFFHRTDTSTHINITGLANPFRRINV